MCVILNVSMLTTMFNNLGSDLLPVSGVIIIFFIIALIQVRFKIINIK